MYSLGRWKRCQLDKDRIHSADWAMVDFLLAQKSKSPRIRTQMTLILVRMNKYFRFLTTGCASSPFLASNIYGEREKSGFQLHSRRRIAAAGAVPCYLPLATGQSKPTKIKSMGSNFVIVFHG